VIESMKNAETGGKTVLLRLDLNVPVKDGTVTDTTRIDRVKDTILTLKEKGAKTVYILSHFGRPKGNMKVEYSLAFLPPVLEKQWGVPVGFAGQNEDTQFILLENLRFHAGEETNDPAFARSLADKGDLYINDAFSCAHRAHASTEGITHYLPSYAGLALAKEIEALEDTLTTPERPVMAIVGGAKISTKLGVLNNLVEKVDYLVLGGGMANSFHVSRGQEMGKSLAEHDMLDQARAISQKAEEAGCHIILPCDCIVIEEFQENAPHETTTLPAFPPEKEAVDCGPQSVEAICKVMDECRTLLWNGPMGVFEMKPFDKGTNKIARHAAKLTKAGQLKTVAGGGDTVSALENAGAAQDFSYISTAGGAFLEWMEGKTLPGIAALKKAGKKAA